MTTTPLTGGCACGLVRFEIAQPLVAAAYCHCTRCQRRTGTAVQASAITQLGSFSLVAGTEHVARWTPEEGNEKAFCRVCGSALFAESPDGSMLAVRLGAIDGDPGVRPTARQFVRYAAQWEPIPEDGLPRFPERVGATPPL